MAQSSARPPISHPYPPTYFANMASSQPAPYPGQRAPGAALLRGEQRESFDYERRRDERFQQSRLSNNVSEVSNRAQVGYSESHPAQSWLPSRERVQGHGQEPFQPDQAPYPSTPSPSYHSEAEPRHVNRLPHPSYSPYDNVPLPQLARESSPSESSTLGILSAQGNSKYPTRADGKPEGWTLEDDEAEREFLRTGMLDWRSMLSLKYWIRKEWWLWYIGGFLIIILVILMTVFHDQIVTWLTPAANWMKNLPGGWAIPIGVLFVISFPPLFGHEIVGIIVGAVWGLWEGFGIVAAGTFLGEIGNFWAFRHCLRGTAERHERKNLNYACLAHVVREGGFWIIFVIRLSAIPGHFSTAVFSTCGTNFWIFCLACLLTLPKQLTVVYLGVIFDANQKSTTDRIVSYTVLAIGFAMTIWAAWFIYKKMNQARLVVWRARRMADKREKGTTQLANKADYKEFLNDGDEEIASPMLQKHNGDVGDVENRPRSYTNPYDIRYHPADAGSIYTTGDTPPQNHHPLPVEEDISYRYNPSQSVESLPTPRPTSHLLTPIKMGSLDPNSPTPVFEYGQGMPAFGGEEFPVARPVGGGRGYEGMLRADSGERAYARPA